MKPTARLRACAVALVVAALTATGCSDVVSSMTLERGPGGTVWYRSARFMAPALEAAGGHVIIGIKNPSDPSTYVSGVHPTPNREDLENGIRFLKSLGLEIDGVVEELMAVGAKIRIDDFNTIISHPTVNCVDPAIPGRIESR